MLRRRECVDHATALGYMSRPSSKDKRVQVPSPCQDTPAAVNFPFVCMKSKLGL